MNATKNPGEVILSWFNYVLLLRYSSGRIQNPEAHVRTAIKQMCEMLTRQQHRSWREAGQKGEVEQGRLGPEKSTQKYVWSSEQLWGLAEGESVSYP